LKVSFLLLPTLLDQTVHHHPAQIKHIQCNHDISQRRGNPSRGKKLIDTPEEKGRADDQGLQEVQAFRAHDELKTQRS
jgi:hypothetical protein